MTISKRSRKLALLLYLLDHVARDGIGHTFKRQKPPAAWLKKRQPYLEMRPDHTHPKWDYKYHSFQFRFTDLERLINDGWTWHRSNTWHRKDVSRVLGEIIKDGILHVHYAWHKDVRRRVYQPVLCDSTHRLFTYIVRLLNWEEDFKQFFNSSFFIHRGAYCFAEEPDLISLFPDEQQEAVEAAIMHACTKVQDNQKEVAKAV